MSSQFRAGACTTDITPPVGLDLTGYGGRPSGCASIHDPLFARALVLDDDDKRLALVSLDVLGVDFDLLDQIRQSVQSEAGIPPEALLVNSSHTHAGPVAETLRGLGERDPEYIAQFIEKAVATVKRAQDTLAPARMGFGRVPVQIGINRRQHLGDGRTVLGQNPEGTVVPYVDILRVDRANGDLLAVWFSHACHPTTLGGDNLAVSAEFPGVAVEVVEKVEGGTALFAQGCCGDINPKRRGSFEAVRRNGRILGAAVVGGAETIQPSETPPTLDAIMETVPLALQKPLPLDEAEKQIASFRAQVEDAKAQGLHRGHVRLRQAWLDWALSMRQYSLVPANAPDTLPFEIQVLRIGDFALVGLPGEVFAEYALAIAERSPFAQTAVLGYTNGCHGYVPTESAYPLGGYEVNDAIRYYGTLMFAPESDRQLRNAAARLLEILKSKTADG